MSQACPDGIIPPDEDVIALAAARYTGPVRLEDAAAIEKVICGACDTLGLHGTLGPAHLLGSVRVWPLLARPDDDPAGQFLLTVDMRPGERLTSDPIQATDVLARLPSQGDPEYPPLTACTVVINGVLELTRQVVEDYWQRILTPPDGPLQALPVTQNRRPPHEPGNQFVPAATARPTSPPEQSRRLPAP